MLKIKVGRYQAQKKYRHRKNIGFDKIAVEIKVVRYQAQKKYWHCKNIGFDKISITTKYHCLQNIGEEKISTSQNIGFGTRNSKRFSKVGLWNV